MEFGLLLLAFCLGGIFFAPIVNAIDAVLGHRITHTTRAIAKALIILVMNAGEQCKIAIAELGEAFQDLVAEAKAEADRSKAATSATPSPPPTEVKIDPE